MVIAKLALELMNSVRTKRVTKFKFKKQSTSGKKEKQLN